MTETVNTGTRPRARFALAALIALAALGVLAPVAQAVPSGFWGAVPQAEPSLEQAQRLERGGVEFIRIPIGWGNVQSQRGAAFDWHVIDRQFETASRAGLHVLPFLTGAPEWAVNSANVPGTGGSIKAPAHLPVSGFAARSWKTFVREAVRRYGPSGRFWAENPSVPKRAVHFWQIWNEPNFKFFVARPNPGQYAKLVTLSYQAVHRSDGQAKIILAGMFSQPKGARRNGRHVSVNWFASDFLEAVYRRSRGIKGKFDGVALHPYTGRYQYLTPEIEEIRDVLEKNNDANTGLWLTELGWSSEPATKGNSFAKGKNGQVKQLKGAFRLLERKQHQWRLRQLFWFSVDDAPGACNFCDGSGLFSEGFLPKRSWYAYVHFAGGRP